MNIEDTVHPQQLLCRRQNEWDGGAARVEMGRHVRRLLVTQIRNGGAWDEGGRGRVDKGHGLWVGFAGKANSLLMDWIWDWDGRGKSQECP